MGLKDLHNDEYSRVFGWGLVFRNTGGPDI